eukprot:350747-Chlamydomonas_euryale.AAC.9
MCGCKEGHANRVDPACSGAHREDQARRRLGGSCAERVRSYSIFWSLSRERTCLPRMLVHTVACWAQPGHMPGHAGSQARSNWVRPGNTAHAACSASPDECTAQRMLRPVWSSCVATLSRRHRRCHRPLAPNRKLAQCTGLSGFFRA